MYLPRQTLVFSWITIILLLENCKHNVKSEKYIKPPQIWYQPVFLVSLISRNWLEARQIQAVLYWGPCYCRGSETKESVFLAPALSWWGMATSFLTWSEGLWCVQGSCRWGLRWSTHPLRCVLCAGDRHSTLLLLQTFQKWQLSFCLFVFFVQNLCHLPVCRGHA